MVQHAPVEHRAFGDRYDRIDADEDAAGLLAYLDDVASIPGVKASKEAASRALRIGPGDVVADIGCGTGVDLPFLVDLVTSSGTVIGVDPSAAAIDAAARATTHLPGVVLYQAGVENLPFEQATIDACRLDRTLQHVATPEEALRELHRVLRPGGRLVVHEEGVELTGVGLAVPSDVLTGLRGADDQAWMPMMLPLMLSRAGFGHISFEPSESHEHDVETISRFLRLRQTFAEHAEARGRPELAQEWWADLTHADLDLRTVSVRVTAVAELLVDQPTDGRP